MTLTDIQLHDNHANLAVFSLKLRDGRTLELCEWINNDGRIEDIDSHLKTNQSDDLAAAAADLGSWSAVFDAMQTAFDANRASDGIANDFYPAGT